MDKKTNRKRKRFLHQLRTNDMDHLRTIYATKMTTLVAFAFFLLIAKLKNWVTI